MAQHFLGGALSSYADFSSNAMMAKLMTASYLKKNAHNIFAKYGTQATLSDFAYDGERKFFKKDFGQHFGNFYMGGLGGLLQSHAMNNPCVRGDELGQGKGLFGKRVTSSLMGYGLEYAGTSYVKANYQGLYTSGWQTKTGVSSYKSLMYSLMLR